MVLDTRLVPRHQKLVTQELVQWLNMSLEEATWDDVDSIKNTFPEFFNATIRSWFPPPHPCGQRIIFSKGQLSGS